MNPLPHAYTNTTTGNGVVVRKVYEGPGSAGRCGREAAALAALPDLLPVPRLVSVGPGELQMNYLPGVHGQELIAGGHAVEVLRACGRMLRRIHAVDLGAVCGPGPCPSGSVLVHGDYGPNNVLLDPDARQVTAVLDWEWAHDGDRLEDLAWCEWVVRMIHPAHVDALEGFFAAYGHRPAWAARHQAMIDKCRALVDFWQQWQPTAERTRQRQAQLAATIGWTE
jgi:aminoglycoside phosphotransferase (APT) family kinase protein